jgi:hypothetical protein
VQACEAHAECDAAACKTFSEKGIAFSEIEESAGPFGPALPSVFPVLLICQRILRNRL